MRKQIPYIQKMFPWVPESSDSVIKTQLRRERQKQALTEKKEGGLLLPLKFSARDQSPGCLGPNSRHCIVCSIYGHFGETNRGKGTLYLILPGPLKMQPRKSPHFHSPRQRGTLGVEDSLNV